MEIIDELEKTKRKVYAGGIGYFSANGEFDMYSQEQQSQKKINLVSKLEWYCWIANL